jgi:hypothetical protein
MAFRNIGVYRDSETIRYHLDHFKTHTPNEWAVYSDLGHFLNSGHPTNIAFVHLPYPFTRDTQSKLDQLREFSDHVFVVGSELHDVTTQFIRDNDYSNITFYICGKLNFTLQHAQVHEYLDWFETTRYCYRDHLPEILTRLKPGPKESQFDILLGRKKPHRDYVNRFAKSNLRVEQYMMTYFNEHQIDFASEHDLWSWEQPGLRFINTPQWTVDMVDYFGHRMSLSQVIPIDIYNRTNYSVVAETNYSNEYSFYTEKTAKPIIARRLFVMFAGQHYLRNLRALGFQTFGSVIDESYDTIADNRIRWATACEQLRWLSSQDPAEIAVKIKPLVEHNFNVMMTKGWLQDYVGSMETSVGNILLQT